MSSKDILSVDITDFAAMASLEKHSEDDVTDRDETLSRAALVEEEIEWRVPGQMLASYRDRKKEQPLLA
jgi:hypothetical protein